jgi:hypothetical protein
MTETGTLEPSPTQIQRLLSASAAIACAPLGA